MPVNFVFLNQKHESEDKGEKKVDEKCVWCDHSGHNCQWKYSHSCSIRLVGIVILLQKQKVLVYIFLTFSEEEQPVWYVETTVHIFLLL